MLKLRDYLPAMKYGAKITAQDIAGMVGLPYVGDIYYIDPTNGNDSYNGTDPKSALKTLGAAYAKLTDNNHDVIVIVPGGTGAGTGTVETAAITWSKNLCHSCRHLSRLAGKATASTMCNSNQAGQPT